MNENHSEKLQTIIFLHIVKTAGTTLHRIIERQFPAEEDYFLREPDHLFGDFLSLSTGERARLRMLRGHMVFGMHEHLPQPATYFTLMRDPIERTISYFHHILRFPNHHAHEAIVSRNIDLREAIERQVDPLLWNGQTRVLAVGKWHDGCTDGALSAAKHNLDRHFSVVGLVDRFDETLFLLKETYGWRKLFYTRQNVGRRPPRGQNLPGEVLDTVREANNLDQHLYNYASQRLDRQIRLKGPRFSMQVKLFKLVNPWVGKLTRLQSRR